MENNIKTETQCWNQDKDENEHDKKHYQKDRKTCNNFVLAVFFPFCLMMSKSPTRS